MYAILDDADVIIGFEKRDIPLEELVHPKFVDHYIFIENATLKVGDIYDRETETFVITPLPEPEPTPEPQETPLSDVEQAIMQTAITTEYMAAMMEATI